MSEEEKKSIELLKAQITLLKHGHNFETTDEYSRLSLKRIYEDALNTIEKQDKMIDLMAEYIVELIEYSNPGKKRETQEIIEHFKKEVENDE